MRILLIFLITTSFCFGQQDSILYTPNSVDYMYGQSFLSHKVFDGGLNYIDGKPTLATPLTFVGIGRTQVYITLKAHRLEQSIYYTQVIPQQLKINDSITSKITGFNIGFNCFSYNVFSYRKRYNVIIALGANTGRLRLYGNSYTHQKNPYFSPKISVKPRLVLGRVCLQLICEYGFDISKKYWRSTYFSTTPIINLPRTSNTGLTVLASISYIINNNRQVVNMRKSNTGYTVYHQQKKRSVFRKA